MMGDHPGLNKSDERPFFAAQNVWDQTMASRILEFKSRHPTTRLVVFTGRGHVSDGSGNSILRQPESDSKADHYAAAGETYRRIGERPRAREDSR